MAAGTKLVKLGGMGRIYVVTAVPEAAQIGSGAHVQIQIGGGYTSVTPELWHLSKADRLKIEVAMEEAEAAKTAVGSMSGSDRPYVPLTVTAEGSIVKLSIAGVEIIRLFVDGGAQGPEPTANQPGEKGWGFAEGDEDEDGDGDGDED